MKNVTASLILATTKAVNQKSNSKTILINKNEIRSFYHNIIFKNNFVKIEKELYYLIELKSFP